MILFVAVAADLGLCAMTGQTGRPGRAFTLYLTVRICGIGRHPVAV
jgi:hypothetical protein